MLNPPPCGAPFEVKTDSIFTSLLVTYQVCILPLYLTSTFLPGVILLPLHHMFCVFGTAFGGDGLRSGSRGRFPDAGKPGGRPSR